MHDSDQQNYFSYARAENWRKKMHSWSNKWVLGAKQFHPSLKPHSRDDYTSQLRVVAAYAVICNYVASCYHCSCYSNSEMIIGQEETIIEPCMLWPPFWYVASFPGLVRLSLAVRNSSRRAGLVHHWVQFCIASDKRTRPGNDASWYACVLNTAVVDDYRPSACLDDFYKMCNNHLISFNSA